MVTESKIWFYNKNAIYCNYCHTPWHRDTSYRVKCMAMATYHSGTCRFTVLPFTAFLGCIFLLNNKNHVCQLSVNQLLFMSLLKIIILKLRLVSHLVKLLPDMTFSTCHEAMLLPETRAVDLILGLKINGDFLRTHKNL